MANCSTYPINERGPAKAATEVSLDEVATSSGRTGSHLERNRTRHWHILKFSNGKRNALASRGIHLVGGGEALVGLTHKHRSIIYHPHSDALLRLHEIVKLRYEMHHRADSVEFISANFANKCKPLIDACIPTD